MSLAATTDFFLTNTSWPLPYYATLYPDAVLTQTSLTGTVADIDEDPDSPDANWMNGVSATVSVLRVSFPTPAAALLTGDFKQEFRVRIRPRP